MTCANVLPIGDNQVLVDLWRDHVVSEICDALPTMDRP